MKTVFSHSDLQNLYDTARAVLNGVEPIVALREPLAILESMAEHRDSADGQVVIESAREQYAEASDGHEIVIDDDTIFYHNEGNGHWVMAWVFVEDESESDEA